MALYAFSRDRRLLSPQDYKRVFDQTLFKIHQPGFLVLATVGLDTSVSRLGLVVAKKKVRRAHERNRLKRLSRESFRLHQHQLCGLDIVILPKSGSDTLDNTVLQQQLHQTWLKLIRLFEKQHRTANSLVTT